VVFFAHFSFSMAVYLSIEKKQEIFAKFGGNENNTGSIEGQVALFTFRIKSLSEHLNKFKKDHATRRSLLMMVGKRKSLLEYLKRKDIAKYRALIQELGIRG
jgi:small subunit ribosomal protein S15